MLSQSLQFRSTHIAFFFLWPAGPVGTKKYINAFQGYINQEQALSVHEFSEYILHFLCLLFDFICKLP